jgi:outer membrane protein TolC
MFCLLLELKETVLNAMQEIESLLTNDEALDFQFAKYQSIKKRSDKIYLNSEIKYTKGTINLSEFVIAKQNKVEIDNTILTLKAEQLINRINLALALGVNVEKSNE